MLDVGLLIAGSFSFILYIFLNYEYLTDRIIYIDEAHIQPTSLNAVLAILIVLEATRRVFGWEPRA